MVSSIIDGRWKWYGEVSGLIDDYRSVFLSHQYMHRNDPILSVHQFGFDPERKLLSDQRGALTLVK